MVALKSGMEAVAKAVQNTDSYYGWRVSFINDIHEKGSFN